MLAARQVAAGPSYKGSLRNFSRRWSSSPTLGAAFGLSEGSNRPPSLHLGARKQQLREAVEKGKGSELKHDDFHKLLEGDDRPAQGLGSRGREPAMDPKRLRRIETLGRKPSLRKLEGIFGEDNLPRRPTRSLKYPSQIKKFVASQLEGSSQANDRVLPREVTDPFMLGEKLTRFVKQRRHGLVLAPRDMEAAIDLVTSAAPEAQNVVVWNQLLGLVGGEGRFDRQFRLYNDMKKRRIHPSTRTYTTMLSSYVKAGTITDEKTRIMSRATIIFDHAMKHVRALAKKPKAAVQDTGLESVEQVDREDESYTVRMRRAVPPDEASVMPVNAYLAFCAQNGLLKEMEHIFLSLDRSGPLSPDSATYTTMLKAVADAIVAPDQKEPAESMPLTARGLWDQAVRQFRTPDESCNPQARKQRQIDFILANQAIVALSKGRWEDQKYAMDIIPALFNLSLPGQSATTPRPPTSPALANLPVLPLNTKTATSILRLTSMLKRHEVAAHFAHRFLDDKDILASADLPFFCLCISAFAESRDVNGFLGIINSYQPPGVEDAGWPLATWHTMLNACRWAKDWRSALIIFRKMTHLPEGIEKGRGKEWEPQTKPQSKKYLKDARHALWLDTLPRRPDSEVMALLMKTGLQSAPEVTLQALRIFMYYPSKQWLYAPMPSAEEQRAVTRARADAYERALEAQVDIDPDSLPKTVRLSLVSDPVSRLAALSISQRKGVQWSLILLEDVERSLTKVLESVKVEEKELEQLESLKADVSRLLLKWEKVNMSDGIRYQK